MKFGLALIAAVTAQQGCVQKCTQTLAGDLQQCENNSQSMKDFVACFGKASVTWGNCLDACQPDPCNNACTKTFDDAVNKCENSGLAPKDELQCISNAMNALQACRQKCKSE